jgi:hypothetical protein
MPAYMPHNFSINTDPHISLTAYTGGIADDEKNITSSLQNFIKDMEKAMSDGGSLASLGDSVNQKYYGSVEGDTIVIPITESFKKSQETTFESFDPASYFSGSFGGAGMMVGANLMHLNGILGKFWSGSSIGIGAFSFSVAVDTTAQGGNVVQTALQKNFDYVKQLEKLCYPKRPELGVFRPPKFFRLWCGVGGNTFFTRKYVGIKRCDIETLGMWQSGGANVAGGKILPTAYNITIEVDDMIVGRE